MAKRKTTVQKIQLLKKSACFCGGDGRLDGGTCLRCLALEVIATKEKVVTGYRTQVDTLRLSNATLQEEALASQRITQNLEDECKESKKEITDLEDECKELKMETVDLGEECKEAKQEIADLNGGFEDLRKDKRELKQNVKDLNESHRQQVSHLEGQLKSARKESQQFKVQYEKQLSQCDSQSIVIEEFRKKTVLDTETIHTLVEAVKNDSIVVAELRDELRQVTEAWHTEKQRGDAFYGEGQSRSKPYLP